ncbi:sulfite oxidase [Arthrobacter crystallopoietes BAB-32]|uniref:Sulfite oxidase n=1 Tax=Arthrobacter crystallopoietes BAB-32 TaxID=1246476 RepID=N1V4P0_9MICC|nr:sulfite oxidase [Arthrobacter crystallopoietes BAB-32]
MPLELLHWTATPVGMHYLLIHFDVPAIDPETWSLRVHGAVQRPLDLRLDDLRAREQRTLAVTMECAGNGRSLMEPRPVSQPWILGAVGTAVWTGTPLSGVLAEAGLEPGAVEVVFTGADRGFQGGVEQAYARSLPVDIAAGEDILLAYEMNGQPLMPQHGFPLRLLVPGWYGMTSVKWLRSIEAVTTPFEGFQQAVAYRFQQDADDPGSRCRGFASGRSWFHPESRTSRRGAAYWRRARLCWKDEPGRGRARSRLSKSGSTASGPRRISSQPWTSTPGSAGPSLGLLPRERTN